MSVFLYTGGLRIVGKSGVGRAVYHQEDMLRAAGIPVVKRFRDPSSVIHINTVLPDSLFAILLARLLGKKVVCYGHSTMEDFRNSFRASNALAPLFRRWITFLYGLGDVVLTPTEYSRRILEDYGIPRPVYNISNGIDTDFFRPDPDRRRAFRTRWGLSEETRVVISVGHFIARKGVEEFAELARSLPGVRFFWFGWTDPRLIPRRIQNAIDAAPPNLCFPGYVEQAELRDAYCGADVFAFLSHEETEGIVVLEALACGIPTVVRDIPVYEGWLESGKNVWKARDLNGFRRTVSDLLDGSLPPLREGALAAAKARSIPAMGEKLRNIYLRENLPAQDPLPAHARGKNSTALISLFRR